MLWAFFAPCASATDLQLVPAGPVRVLSSPATNACGPDFIPDSAARAFRRGDGQLAVIASHFQNWMLIGKDIWSLVPVCQSILPREVYSKHLRGKLWIQATYTLDGVNIEGIASHDLWQAMRADGCERGDRRGRCWLNQLVGVRSRDMGSSFHVVGNAASFGNTYPASENDPVGFFSVSNIVRRENFFYMLVYVRAGTRQRPGNCLLRTSDIKDPTSWRGWDGQDFSYMPLAPERECKPIFPDTLSAVRSVQYVPSRNLWVALISGRRKLSGDAVFTPGYYYSTSSDLVHWGQIQRLMAVPVAPRIDDIHEIHSYPSLMDPNSISRNFETLDHADAVLLFIVHHLKDGRGTMNRDLQLLPISIR